MIVANTHGLPDGDTDSPVLCASPRGGTPSIIDTTEGLSEAAAQLRSASQPVAVDVERAQGFKYGADPYLIQIRREDVGTFLIDTAALPDLSCLSFLNHQRWLLHAADQDLPNIRQLGLSPTSLFDTEVAARLLGLERFGLASVCETILGLTLAKDHQASNWSVRPLPSTWLRYAALDVELLTALYQRMARQLHDADRWEWAEQEFAYILHMPAPKPKADRWRALPGASKISDRRQLEVLRCLWQMREDVAHTLNIAPGKLLRNTALVRAAQAPPRNKRALQAIAEFRTPIARQYADRWLRAITVALTANEADLPPRKVPPPAGHIPEARFWAKTDPEAHQRLQAVRAAVQASADTLGIAQDVLLAPKVQRYVAWAVLERSRGVEAALRVRLDESDARPWQKDIVTGPLVTALGALV
ncbi:HRDC domain-containing protein [Schaalia suimastitidis]|uniref:HRDC domain-containing protein n=1 Tax=Schaalia suimastitidis TaxID=121163 RepID=UPI0004165B7C|nr:HRDC domain-containing protein [Schaalia suimastitidis]